MLTSSQLSDLFSRLDRNGDGELDLDEFTGIIKMLKINTTADYIARVFRSVDQARGGELAGTLDMQEFIAAYQKIYCGAPITELMDNGAKRETFVRATRYGCTADGTYLFECYTIPSDGVPEKHQLVDLPTATSGYTTSTGDRESLEKLSRATSEPWIVDNKPGTIDNLDRMLRLDSARNKTSKAKILWWVDVACSAVDRSTAEELVAKFGLPNNSKFISSFGNFGNGLPADPKSRIFAGNGIDTNGSVYSLSFFAQAQYILNVPVVHHLPPVLRKLQCFACENNFFSGLSEWVVSYYTSRFAWMANLSWLAHTSDDERIGAYERAEGLASLLWMLRTGDPDTVDYEDTDDEDDDLEDGDEQDTPALESPSKNKYKVEEEGPSSNHTIFSSSGGGVPIKRRMGYIYPPTWLRSNSQLYTMPPVVAVDSLGVHILDQGYGAHTLLTVRQIDGEKQKKLTLEQQARAGVLGRIVSGVWVKLAEVIMKGRSAGVAGELADSPGTLATFVLMLLHNFSMNSVAPVDYWLNVLEKEIKDIVVSKHSAHLSEVERVLKDFNSYLDPLEGIMQSLAQEQEDILSAERERLMAEELLAAEQQELKHDSLHSDSESEQDKIAPIATRSPSSGKHLVPARPQSAFGRAKQGRAQGHRRGSIVAAAKLEEALPEGVEKVSLSYAIIERFFGADPYREIHRHLEGYEQMEIKGLVYWKERLKKYSLKVENLKHLISTQLDEKRNFMSFMLTIITTILAPLAILTGYFGMNFTNMKELDPDAYPSVTPGVVLMWVICGISYGSLLMFALHFRVLYSAT